MLERITAFLRSPRSGVVLMALYAVLMAAATFVEKYTSTATAKALVYYSPLFLLLQGAMVANFVAVTLSRRLMTAKRLPYVLIHAAFVVILTGAAVTHFFSDEGTVQLREGGRTDRMLVRKGAETRFERLPFEVELVDFELTRYPGSQSPSSFESRLKIRHDGRVFEERVYMNHVLDFEGFRFFQASYDPDEQGSVLSVSRDVAGRSITYTGYVLLFAGLAGCFLDRHSRFRRLCRTLKAVLWAAVLCGGVTAEAQQVEPSPGIDPVHAARFGELPMQSADGRIIPVNTFSSQLGRKLRIDEVLPDADPDRFLLGLLVFPQHWAHRPIIRVEDGELAGTLTQGRELISYRDAFDRSGRYRWGDAVERVYRKSPSERSKSDRELLRLDERVNLLHQLFNRKLVRIFPRSDDFEGHHWLAPGDDLGTMLPADSARAAELFRAYVAAVVSGDRVSADRCLDDIRTCQERQRAGLEIPAERIAAEAHYNRADLLPHARRGYLILGGVLLALSFAEWFGRRKRGALHRAELVAAGGVIAVFVLHACDMGLRWYVAGHAPWSNSYETMVLLAWVAVGGGLCFLRRSFMTFALSVLFGGVVLFVSGLSWMDPQITPLVPVLKSPWLMFHVATLMAAYGFLGIGCMISTLNLVAAGVAVERNRDDIAARTARLSVICELALTAGLALMMVGIFLGAVWANESWGRYWSWDPKETWALITAVVYAAVLHLRWFERRRNDLRFNLLTQWAFLAVLMTYFGVNYLLSGMHAYGNTGGLSALPWWAFVVAGVFFVLPGLAAFVRRGK